MTQNPFYNAVLAAGYIVLVVTVMSFTQQVDIPEPSMLIPITMLSLFVLSATMMGYIFFYQPVQMYLDGDKKAAVDLFLKTLGFFACITVVLIGILFSTAF